LDFALSCRNFIKLRGHNFSSNNQGGLIILNIRLDMKNIKSYIKLIFMTETISGFLFKYIFFSCFFIMLSNNLSAQRSKICDFPVHYGTPEWEKLSTFRERLQAYNIPDSLLKYMTTGDLVKICLAYPEWMLISICNNFQEGYDLLRSVFNGFVELEKRPDAFKELFNMYQNMDPEKISKISKKGLYVLQFTHIELLLSQRCILSSLKKSELISLIQNLLIVYEKKCNYLEIFSTFGLSTTCLILGRILEQGYSDIYKTLINTIPEFQRFINVGRFGPNKILLDKIIAASKEYLKQLEL